MKFSDISLSTRITFWALLLVAAGGLLWIGKENQRQHEAYLGERSADLVTALHVEQARLNQSIETLRQDVVFLANTPPVAGMARASEHNGADPRDKTSYAMWEARLQEIFAAFLRAHPDYFMASYIAAAGEGRELVRVENREGGIEVTGHEALQAKGEQDYFRAGLMLTVGRVRLSEFVLNQEWGKIEEPRRPTLRAVTPVFDASGHVFGMLVINKDLRPLFAQSSSGLPSGVQTYIADQRGRYLFHPDAKRAFAFEFGDKGTITDDFPSLQRLFETQAVQDELPSHALSDGAGGYLAAQRIFFDAGDPARFLLLAYHLPEQVLARQETGIPVLTLVETGVVMLLVSGLFMLMLRRTFAPLAGITVAAREIAAGNRLARLAETGQGEIGKLSAALNHMLEKLSDRELIERENSFRKALIESLPGVFYMIDMQGRYLMWNRNLEQVLQRSSEELASCHALDFFDGVDKANFGNAIRTAFEAGETSVEAALTAKDGSRIPYHFTGRRVERDGEPVLIGMGLDLSEQRESVRVTMALLQRYQALMQSSMEGIHVMDVDGNVLEANDAFCGMLGYTREEALRLNAQDWDGRFAVELPRASFEGLIGKSGLFEAVYRRKDGSELDVEICANGVEIDGQGYLFAASRDITERKKAQAVLQRHQLMIETAMDGFWVIDANGFLEEVNEAYAKMSGYTMQELAGMHIDQLEAADGAENLKAYTDRIMAQGYARFETRHRRKDGRVIDVELSVTFLPEGQKFFVFSHNITRRKQAEQELRVAAAAFEMHEAIIITDAHARIIRVNQAFTETTGYTAEEVLGQNPRIMSSGRHDHLYYARMWQQLLHSGSWAGEIWDRRKNGVIYPKWMSITAVRDERQEATQYVAIFSDITERKRTEEGIRNLAFYDALTQLPNRRMFTERLRSALSASERHRDCGAVLFLDIGRLKTINDTLGYDYGDLMLVDAANRIKSCVRDMDTVARLGGGEFAVMLEGVGSGEQDATHKAAIVAEKIRAALAHPYQIKEHEYPGSPCIGIALYRGHEQPVEALWRRADLAMYQAREGGRDAVCFFDPLMQDNNGRREAQEGMIGKRP